jgi:hypothetical protein
MKEQKLTIEISKENNIGSNYTSLPALGLTPNGSRIYDQSAQVGALHRGETGTRHT